MTTSTSPWSCSMPQFKAALNGNPTMLIWLGKQYLGQRDRPDITGPDGDPRPTLEMLDRLIKESHSNGTGDGAPVEYDWLVGSDPRTCTVCLHPERQEIDAAIIAGAPNRRIATRHSLTEAAGRRHRATHLPTRLVRAQAVAMIPDATSRGGTMLHVSRTA